MEMKFPCASASAGPKYACAEMFQWWNVRFEMSLTKISGAEMVPKAA